MLKRFGKRKNKKKKTRGPRHNKSKYFPSHMAQVATCDGCTSAKEKVALLYVCIQPPSISHMPVQIHWCFLPVVHLVKCIDNQYRIVFSIVPLLMPSFKNYISSHMKYPPSICSSVLGSTTLRGPHQRFWSFCIEQT